MNHKDKEGRRGGIQRKSEVLWPNEWRRQQVLGRNIKWKEGRKEGKKRKGGMKNREGRQAGRQVGRMGGREEEKPGLLQCCCHFLLLCDLQQIYFLTDPPALGAQMRDAFKCLRPFPVLSILWLHVTYTQILLKSQVTDSMGA